IVFDDGSGPRLHAAGNFYAGSLGAHNLGRWNGSDWEPLGAGIVGEVDAVAAHDDGTGPALVAGGDFHRAGGLPANALASRKTPAWAALGGGSGVDSTVLSLLPFDDGSGPKLIVGGAFGAAGDGIQNGIAAWDGSTWSPLGTGLDFAGVSPPRANALALFDDG